MRQIDRMAHPGAYSGCDQALFAMSRDEFRKATELGGAEAGPGRLVNPQSSCQEQGCRQPAPQRRVKPQISPLRCLPQPLPTLPSRTVSGCDMENRPRPPEVHTRMDDQPECRDGGINDASQPTDGSEKDQHAADYSCGRRPASAAGLCWALPEQFDPGWSSVPTFFPGRARPRSCRPAIEVCAALYA